MPLKKTPESFLLTVDYDSRVPESYRGIHLVPDGLGGSEHRIKTNNPVDDWDHAYRFASEMGVGISLTSSAYNFVWDRPDLILEHGIEGRTSLAPLPPGHRPMQGFEEEGLAYHPDPAVRVWNSWLDGSSAAGISRWDAMPLAQVKRILGSEPPRDIASDLRYMTGMTGHYRGYTHPGSGPLTGGDGTEMALILILTPRDITWKLQQSALRQIRDELRASDAPGFGFDGIAERLPVGSLLRMAHRRGYRVWEIGGNGRASLYDGRFASLIGIPEPESETPSP